MLAGCARAPEPSPPTSGAGCALAYDRVIYRTQYADQDRPFEGSWMAQWLSDLNYTTIVRWNDAEIAAQKLSNWTLSYPAYETFSVVGVNGSHSFEAALSVTLKDPCSTKAQRDAACDLWPQSADLAFGFFEEGPGWRATGYGDCYAEPPIGS